MARHITEKQRQETLKRIDSAALSFPVIFERLFPYSEYRDGDELLVRPPVFPEGELVLCLETGSWSDYSCERHGDGIVSLVKYIFDLDLIEAAQMVFDRVSAASLEQRGLKAASGYVCHQGRRS